MGHDLMSKEIEVDPVFTLTTKPTTEQAGIESAGRFQIIDRKSQVKGNASCYGIWLVCDTHWFEVYLVRLNHVSGTVVACYYAIKTSDV